MPFVINSMTNLYRKSSRSHHENSKRWSLYAVAHWLLLFLFNLSLLHLICSFMEVSFSTIINGADQNTLTLLPFFNFWDFHLFLDRFTSQKTYVATISPELLFVCIWFYFVINFVVRISKNIWVSRKHSHAPISFLIVMWWFSFKHP